MIKSQADERLEEVTAPVDTSPEIQNQSAQIEESTDDVNTVRMLGNEEETEENCFDSKANTALIFLI